MKVTFSRKHILDDLEDPFLLVTDTAHTLGLRENMIYHI